MTNIGNLWAVGFDDMERAAEVRDEITSIAGKYLILLEAAVVVRHPDGSFTFDRTPRPGVANILACSALGLLAGLAVAAPLTGATVGALVGGAGNVAASQLGIGKDFIREVEGLMKPGTSALFVLDDAGDMDVILHTIRGLGGTVVKTNVDLERAKLIQSTLAAASTETNDC